MDFFDSAYATEKSSIDLSDCPKIALQVLTSNNYLIGVP